MNLLTQYQAVQSSELDKQYLENVISDNLKQIDQLKEEISMKDDEIKNLKWKVSSIGEGTLNSREQLLMEKNDELLLKL